MKSFPRRTNRRCTTLLLLTHSLEVNGWAGMIKIREDQFKVTIVRSTVRIKKKDSPAKLSKPRNVWMGPARRSYAQVLSSHTPSERTRRGKIETAQTTGKFLSRKQSSSNLAGELTQRPHFWAKSPSPSTVFRVDLRATRTGNFFKACLYVFSCHGDFFLQFIWRIGFKYGFPYV